MAEARLWVLPNAIRPSIAQHRPVQLAQGASLLLGAVLGDSAGVGFRKRAPKRGGVEVSAVSGCTRLLSPGMFPAPMTPILM